MKTGTQLAVLILLLPCTFMAASASAQDPTSLTHLSDSFEALVQRISPAVVEIFATGYGPIESSATTSNLLTKRRTSGSGVILHSDGYIITNAHVVVGARRVQVMLPSGKERLKSLRSILKPTGRRVGAQVIGIDRETDLAVIKVQAKDLPYLDLSDSDDLRQGQIVLAFGSPFGLENSVSMGIVSAVSRQARTEDPMIYIQTDATINPGNSGGPLVDTDGHVVGINTFIISHAGGSEGIGFAAPSNIVKNVYNQIRASGRVRRGHIGVHAQTVTPTIARGLGLNREWGVILGDVSPSGPADRAGLHAGDVILTMDGKVMENARQFDVNLYRHAIGDHITLEIEREDGTATVRVAVIERRNDPTRFSDFIRPDRNLIPELGILALDLSDRIRHMLPSLRSALGVVVAARALDAPFQREALMPGDVIHSLNAETVRDLEGLRKAVAALRPGDSVVCQVERSGRLLFVAFEID